MEKQYDNPIREVAWREATLGGPGLDGYAYRAALYCTTCAREIMRALLENYPDYTLMQLVRDGNSDEFPVPVFFGESDHAEHCDKCGMYLYGRDDGPGKFEGATPYAAYYYNVSLDGGFDDECGDIERGRHDGMFRITDEDRLMWGARWISADDQCIVVTETDDGFVDASTCTMEEWEHFVNEMNADDDSEETASDGTGTGTSNDPRTRGY